MNNHSNCSRYTNIESKKEKQKVVANHVIPTNCIRAKKNIAKYILILVHDNNMRSCPFNTQVPSTSVNSLDKTPYPWITQAERKKYIDHVIF